MLFPRLLTQHTSEAMHVQRNDGQSNRSGKSLSTFRPNTVEATVFKIVDGRLHSGVLTANSSKRFTLFAVPLSLAEAALLGQDVVNPPTAPWSTIYNRFNRWSKAGIWDKIFDAIVDSHNVDTVMVDATSIRAHPSAAKLKKNDKRRCLGRSRGGLGTKIRASNNQDGLPLKLELTPGQAHDSPVCETLLTGLQPGQ